jgi:glycine cleavage system transcriptional repressor
MLSRAALTAAPARALRAAASAGLGGPRGGSTRPLAQAATAAPAAAGSAANDRAQATRARRVVLSLAGADRVGIVSDFTTTALRHSVNVEETRMARLGGEFCIIGMLAVPAEREPAALAAVFQTTFPGFTVSCRHSDTSNGKKSGSGAHPDAGPQAAAVVMQDWNIELEGPDQLGIVAAVTEELAKNGANIHELETETTQAPFAGFTLFKMDTTFGIDPAKIEDVATSMANVESRFGVSVLLAKADDTTD